MKTETKKAIIYAIAVWVYFAICLYILTPMVMQWWSK
jgi:hypothetical protein